MITLYFILYLVAGVCFGCAAGNVNCKRINFVAFGLLFWVLVPLMETLHKL